MTNLTNCRTCGTRERTLRLLIAMYLAVAIASGAIVIAAEYFFGATALIREHEQQKAKP